MKKRTWYLTLLTIITVICIAIGLLVHVVLPAGNWLSDMSDDLDECLRVFSIRKYSIRRSGGFFKHPSGNGSI